MYPMKNISTSSSSSSTSPELAKERRRARVEYMKTRKNLDIPDYDDQTVLSDISGGKEMFPVVDSKKELRKIRNRESAEASRKRKRDDVSILQQQVDELINQVNYFKTKLSKYEPVEGFSYSESKTVCKKRSGDNLYNREPAVFKFMFL